MSYPYVPEAQQKALKSIGFYDGAIDHKLGPKTAAAIARCKKLQTDLRDCNFFNGKIDGWPGPLTLLAMRECKDWQVWLNAHGFACGPVDGWPGKQTKAALESFQKAAGCKLIDHKVGPETTAKRINWSSRVLSPAPAAQAPSMPPAGSELHIIDPHLNFMYPLTPRKVTKYIVFHHAAASVCTIEDIHRWHLQRGWNGCGYNFFVRKDGSIYEGRGLNMLGAHCQDHNWESVGICAEGNYNIDTMPDAQKSALIALGRYVREHYPNARPVGHRELNPTACPGKNYPLEEIKERVLA